MSGSVTSSVTIPADVARQIAARLRSLPGSADAAGAWADLLDPPVPSLRDEAMAAARMFRYRQQTGYGASAESIDYDMADEILAVVRRHVEVLPTVSMGDAVAGVWVRGIDRDDVLRLLGGEDGTR